MTDSIPADRDPSAEPDPIEQVLESVAASRRYRHVAASTVRRLAAGALASARGRPREAAKRTKRSLHQVFGAFLPAPPPYDRLLETLAVARGAGGEALREALLEAMGYHASTRERRPILTEFYDRVLEGLGPVGCVADLGCGLNPLAAPWMQLAPEARYWGLEIDDGLVGFLAAAFDLLGVERRFEVGDLLDRPPIPAADVTLALKLLPTLEQQRAGAGAELIESLSDTVAIVSFPTRSLGRRSKGMARTYRESFERLAAARGWRAERIELPGELVYRLPR